MTSDMPHMPEPVQVDAGKILQVLQESHPDAVRYAVWRVRAEDAEARLREANTAQAE